MLAGFVDGRGRKYDLNFRTLRTRMLDEDGMLVVGEGDHVQSRAPCEAEASVRLGEKSLAFLLRCPGDVTATSRRYVFLVGLRAPRPQGQLTLLNVKLPIHPTAIASFFAEQGGREYLEFTRDDVVVAREARSGVAVELRGPAPGRADEAVAYLATFDPAAGVREVFEDLL